MNWVSEKLGRGRISLSKKIKNSVKGVVSYVSNFELTAAELAITNGYDYVVCGHIHQPEIKELQTKNGEKVMYLNSGDWVENSTALEYHDGAWKLYFEDQAPLKSIKSDLIKSRREELSIEVLLAEITQNIIKT